jgi:GT2 family glycosyltransferase
MGKSPPRVAAVIPNWNGAGDLRACLASLEGQRGVELELVVVDNGSTDGSLELLRSSGTPHVALPENTGFAPAMNLGFERTGAEFVLALNSDTVLEPDAVARLAGRLTDEPELGGVQPRILASVRGGALRDPDDPDARIYSLGQVLSADGRAFEAGSGRRQGNIGRDPGEIFGVCGAACLLRRSMLEGTGGYDDRYFAFYEDVDLNVRARIAGWSFELVPDAVVWHVGNASWQAGFEKPAAENARLVARNRLCTQIKFMPLRSLPLIALVEAGAVLRAIRDRRLMATVTGKLQALRLLPEMLAERRRLRSGGDPERARRWLGKGST